MNGLACDLCDKTLLIEENVRYVVDIQVYAAYDPLELTAADLEKDWNAELRALVKRMETMNADEAQDSIYRHFRFHLCPACQKKYIKDPLQRENIEKTPE